MPDGSLPILEVHRLGTVPYQEALELQEELIVKRREGTIPDQLLLLEHPHVITLGSSTEKDHVLLTPEERSDRGIELHEVGRGGDVTYHGPGQLIGYPILSLSPHRKDLHQYLRDLEEVLIRTLIHFGLTGAREDGLTGVWLPQGKVAAIGVRVSSGWITSHGFALNVNPDLSFFSTIVPCGIQDRSVVSMTEVLNQHLTPSEVIHPLVESFGKLFSLQVVVV